MLNGRVRNGNGCGHPGLLTGKSPGTGPGTTAGAVPLCQLVAVRLLLHEPARVGRTRTEQGINAVKRSAVSTGQLRPLLALHTRPIDPVVFREPSPPRGPEAWSCGGFHA